MNNYPLLIKIQNQIFYSLYTATNALKRTDHPLLKALESTYRSI